MSDLLTVEAKGQASQHSDHFSYGHGSSLEKNDRFAVPHNILNSVAPEDELKLLEMKRFLATNLIQVTMTHVQDFNFSTQKLNFCPHKPPLCVLLSSDEAIRQKLMDCSVEVYVGGVADMHFMYVAAGCSSLRRRNLYQQIYQNQATPHHGTRGKREIPEKSGPPATSSGTIPTCENLGVTRPGIGPGSPWCEVIRLTAQPPRPWRSVTCAVYTVLEDSAVGVQFDVGIRRLVVRSQRDRSASYLVYGCPQSISSVSSLAGPSWVQFLDSEVDVDEYFRAINIPFNCKYLVVRQSGDVATLTEVYYVRHPGRLLTTSYGNWSHQRGTATTASRMYERRTGLQGAVVKAVAMHVSADHCYAHCCAFSVHAAGATLKMFAILALSVTDQLRSICLYSTPGTKDDSQTHAAAYTECSGALCPNSNRLVKNLFAPPVALTEVVIMEFRATAPKSLVIAETGATSEPPTSVLNEDDDGTLHLGGYLGDLWAILERRINFTKEHTHITNLKATIKNAHEQKRLAQAQKRRMFTQNISENERKLYSARKDRGFCYCLCNGIRDSLWCVTKVGQQSVMSYSDLQLERTKTAAMSVEQEVSVVSADGCP
ncbi:hypothetical protein PR048_014881 [Dryococelus australis]|uniref:Uncharacterized protein n=1 Tax=Dryococelus australis TaxID=614101 RepID=A0ABQ9HFM5_9NEOP|nr:hypothetical protein PR048_014881 [Dryococelus australis]